MRGPIRFLLLGASLFALPSCSEPPRAREGASSGLPRYDSAGVTISVTASAEASRLLPWDVSDSPDLIIGDGPSPQELFSSVEGVAPLQSGGVAVVDGADRQIRLFDRSGSLVGRIGGRGRGPGEFLEVGLAPTQNSDSIIVYDGGLRRFHYISTINLRFRVHTTTAVRGGRPPLGVTGGKALFLSGVRRRSRPGIIRMPMTFRWVDLVTQRETAVATVTTEAFFAEDVPGQAAPTAWRRPFTLFRPLGVVSPTGARLYLGGPAELREYDFEGHLTRIFRLDAPLRPVTTEMIDAWIEEFTSTTSVPADRIRRIVEEMPLPTLVPAFGALLQDSEGWTWAGIYDPAQQALKPSHWIIFDDDGRAQGTVVTPQGLAVRAITSSSILGVWTSPLGVQEVRRYGLNRP